MSNIDQLKSLASSKLGFARANQFLVELPTSFSSGGFLGALTTLFTSGNMGGGNLNLLCASATLPGKQLLTLDRRTGMQFEKVAYGYAVDDVNLSFVALNDYGTRKYFDAWRERVIDETGQTVGYKRDYAKPVKIHQLRKPIKALGTSIGPININVGLGGGTVYSVELIDAFPTTIGQVELTNELDGLVQINVQLSYTNWQRASSGQQWIQASAGLGSLSQFLG